ncbi:MAG: ABC transporter permease [Rhodothermia bacterium]|nr:ABC transporter permease [Rhodothermia bacterium]
MGLDLLIVWLIVRKLKGRAQVAVYLLWMALCLALAVFEVRYSFKLVRPGLDPTPPLAVILLRVGAIVAVLEAYFLSTLVWMPRLFDRMERLPAEVLIAVRQLRSRKSGFLTAISFLAFLGVGLGSFALCMTIAIMGGFGNDLKTKILGNNAHVVVDRERGGFSGWRPLLERIRRVPEVSVATPLVQGEVMVTSQTNLSGVILRGIDPSAVGSVLNLRRDLIRGRVEYLADPSRLDNLHPLERRPVSARGEEDIVAGGGPSPARPPSPASLGTPVQGNGLGAPTDVLPGIIVGRELASNLHLAVGDEVRVVSPYGSMGPLGPIPKTKLFRVAGIFYSGMYEYDTKYAYITIPVAQRFFNHRDDAITAIEVRLTDVDRSDDVLAAIRPMARGMNLRVRDWKELNQNLFRALKLEKLMIFLLLTVAIIVASFSIVATLLLLVTEKGREIAVLKAMGASDGFITRVFLAVGGLIGVVGSSLGTSGALIVALAAKRVGIPLDPEVYYIERLPVIIAPWDFALVFVTAVLICLAAAAFPAWLAGRLRPVEGLRFD